MKNKPSVCIGHLRVVDHLILGFVDRQLKTKKRDMTHSNLEIKPMNAWEQVSDRLKEGSLDGAFIPAPLAMNLFASGLDIRLLMFVHRSGSLIVKKRNPEIKSIKDFQGKTVLVSSKLSIQNMLLHRLLSSVKLKPGTHEDTRADVIIETANPSLMNEMLANDPDNDIAGVTVAEPFGSEAIFNGLASKICTSQTLWQNHPCCVFVLKTSFIKQDSKAVQEIVDLFIHAGQHIENTPKNKMVSLSHDFLDQKKEIVEKVLLKTNISYKPSLLVPDIDALNIIQNYMADVMGVLKNKIEITDFVDNSFILDTISENRL